MSLKQTILFDSNLLSGSSERLRSTFDSNYKNDSGTYFVDFSRPESIKQVDTNRDLIDSDEASYLPVLSFPARLTGMPDSFVSDEDWRAYLVGSTFSETEYSGVYDTGVYADHAINDYYFPFKPSEVERNSEGLSPSIVLTTEYYQNYSRYQAYASGLASELSLPNYYNLKSNLFMSLTNDQNYPRHQYNLIKNFMNLGFVNQDVVLDEANKNVFVLEKTLNSNSSTFMSRLGAATVPSMTLNQNMSDQNTLARKTDSTYISTEDDLSKIYSLMPFANKLEISEQLANFNTTISTTTSRFGTIVSSNLFKMIIESGQYEYKFMKLLKETFQNEISLTPSTVNFGLSTGDYSIDYEAGTATELTSSTSVALKVVDVPTMLVYGFRNPVPETTDVSVINASSFQDQIDPFEDTNGTYRHIAADKSLDVLNSFKEVINKNFDTIEIDSLEEFFNQAGGSKYHETMAFRIQKIGGPPTGDSRTENTIQNIWFYNRNEAIKYIDTQVKYDTEYTYKVFSYVLLQGYKYQTTGLVATRKIDEFKDMNCLEFYDPYTGQTSPQLNSEENLRSAFEAAEVLERDIAELNERIVDLEAFYNEFVALLVSDNPLNPDRVTYFESFFDGDPAPRPNTIISPQYITLYENLVDPTAGVQNTARYPQPDYLLSDVVGWQKMKLAVEDFVNKLLVYIGDNEPLLDERDELTRALGAAREFANALASNAQINTEERFLADFKLAIEPSVKIVEIPLEEKTMRIVDHPPNDFNVSPYHLRDQSNRLAFYLKYDTFSVDAEPYPPTISAIDERNEASYKEGKDFVPGSLTKEESVSPARFVEVYRMMEKPTSYQSFENNLRTTIDLKSVAGDIASDHFFVERVRENTKYYYTFRAVNENGVAGQPSPIFESELINDGGYVYGLFNQLSEDELVEQPPTIPTLAIKNLFNVVPNIQHLQFDTSNVDFSDNSVDQIGALTLGTAEEFWNEKFKIRLTSKKTGRKVDLNLTFERKKK
tara:strand:- start:2934 stop:5924 length:2991 start_codon:yes stop_codon:yes gene_type:complete